MAQGLALLFLATALVVSFVWMRRRWRAHIASRGSWDNWDPLLGLRRTIVLDRSIDDEFATVIIAKLLYLESENADDPIHLHVDSDGGVVTAALAIADAMDHVKPRVHTRCLGRASGVALLLVAHGARGSRSAAPDARFGLVPLADGTGKRADEFTAAQADEYHRLEMVFAEMLAGDTGQTLETLLGDLRQSRYFDAEEALSYRLIDEVERRGYFAHRSPDASGPTDP